MKLGKIKYSLDKVNKQTSLFLLATMLFCMVIAILFSTCQNNNNGAKAQEKKEQDKPEPQHIVWEGEMTIKKSQRIEKGSSITIMPGSKITFEHGGKIVSWGDVIIKGTPEERIHLIAIDPADKHQILQVYGETNKLHVHHTDIKDGLTVSYMTDTHFKDVHFSNSLKLEWNYAMLRIFKSPILIEDCVIDWNYYGEGILVHRSNNPIIRNCTFYNQVDAVEFIHVNDGLISNCTFNKSYEDIVDFNHTKRSRIENSTFYDAACAIEIGSQGLGISDSITVDNCLFVKCNTGIYVKESSSVDIHNSTFIKSSMTINAVSHPDSSKHSFASINNSIINGSKKGLIEKDGAKIVFNETISDSISNLDGIQNINFKVKVLEKGEAEINSTDLRNKAKINNTGYQGKKLINTASRK